MGAGIMKRESVYMKLDFVSHTTLVKEADTVAANRRPLPAQIRCGADRNWKQVRLSISHFDCSPIGTFRIGGQLSK